MALSIEEVLSTAVAVYKNIFSVTWLIKYQIIDNASTNKMHCIDKALAFLKM